MFPSVEDIFIWGAILFAAVILGFGLRKIWNHHRSKLDSRVSESDKYGF